MTLLIDLLMLAMLCAFLVLTQPQEQANEYELCVKWGL